jgi:hypothetical protein
MRQSAAIDPGGEYEDHGVRAYWIPCADGERDDEPDGGEVGEQDYAQQAEEPPGQVVTELPDVVFARELRQHGSDAGDFILGREIERWHQTLKNRILLENYYLPGELQAQIDAFVQHYNHHRYDESLNNLTSADVYFGRAQTVLLDRQRIKQQTIRQRRLLNLKQAAKHQPNR